MSKELLVRTKVFHHGNVISDTEFIKYDKYDLPYIYKETLENGVYIETTYIRVGEEDKRLAP